MTEQSILQAPDETVVNGKDMTSRQDTVVMNAKQLRESNQQNLGVVKLTNWVKEPSITELKNDLASCKTFRDVHVNNVNRWEVIREGGTSIRKRRGRSSIRPKLVRRQAEWRYSALSEPFLSAENIFQVSPVTFEDKSAASQNAILINWQFRTKIGKIRLVNEAVRTFVDEGTVIFRPGWVRETKQEMTTVPIWEYTEVYEGTPEEEALIQALQVRDQNPRAFTDLDPALQESIRYSQENGVTAWAQAVGETQILKEKIVKNHPTVVVVDYRNIYIDPSCGNDPDKAGFIVASFETSKAELKKDGRYKNLETVNYAGAELLGDTEHGTTTPQDFNFSDELRRRVVAYEYWGLYDIKGDGVLVPIVATWLDNQLIRMEENPFPDKKPPFVFAAYSPKKKSVFGEPDAELLEDNQSISGALIRGMIDLLGRSANSQQGIQKGMLDVTNRRRFENGEDYEFNPSNSPHSGLIEHKYPELPRSALELLSHQNQEAESLSGVKAFAGGISGDSYGDVVAGIKGALDAAAKREMDILRRLADALKQVADKIIAMNGVFLSEEEVVRVTNELFVPVKREELAGEFDLITDISTPEIDERKAADLSFMLQTAASVLPFKFTQMLLAEIAALRKMPTLAKNIETFTPEPDPLQEALKQLEVKKVELEISKIDSEIAKNRAATEKLIAEADAIDLDTEMRGSGISHAQDMEKQSEQARGNQDLAVTKALTAPRKEGETTPNIEEVMGFNAISKTIATASNRPSSIIPPAQEVLDPTLVSQQ